MSSNTGPEIRKSPELSPLAGTVADLSVPHFQEEVSRAAKERDSPADSCNLSPRACRTTFEHVNELMSVVSLALRYTGQVFAKNKNFAGCIRVQTDQLKRAFATFTHEGSAEDVIRAAMDEALFPATVLRSVSEAREALLRGLLINSRIKSELVDILESQKAGPTERKSQEDPSLTTDNKVFEEILQALDLAAEKVICDFENPTLSPDSRDPVTRRLVLDKYSADWCPFTGVKRHYGSGLGDVYEGALAVFNDVAWVATALFFTHSRSEVVIAGALLHAANPFDHAEVGWLSETARRNFGKPVTGLLAQVRCVSPDPIRAPEAISALSCQRPLQIVPVEGASTQSTNDAGLLALVSVLSEEYRVSKALLNNTGWIDPANVGGQDYCGVGYSTYMSNLFEKLSELRQPHVADYFRKVFRMRCETEGQWLRPESRPGRAGHLEWPKGEIEGVVHLFRRFSIAPHASQDPRPVLSSLFQTSNLAFQLISRGAGLFDICKGLSHPFFEPNSTEKMKLALGGFEFDLTREARRNLVEEWGDWMLQRGESDFFSLGFKEGRRLSSAHETEASEFIENLVTWLVSPVGESNYRRARIKLRMERSNSFLELGRTARYAEVLSKVGGRATESVRGDDGRHRWAYRSCGDLGLLEINVKREIEARIRASEGEFLDAIIGSLSEWEHETKNLFWVYPQHYAALLRGLDEILWRRSHSVRNDGEALEVLMRGELFRRLGNLRRGESLIANTVKEFSEFFLWNRAQVLKKAIQSVCATLRATSGELGQIVLPQGADRDPSLIQFVLSEVSREMSHRDAPVLYQKIAPLIRGNVDSPISDELYSPEEQAKFIRASQMMMRFLSKNRETGTPRDLAATYGHVLEVGMMLAMIRAPADVVIGGILHDLYELAARSDEEAEDKSRLELPVLQQEIAQAFGSRTHDLVELVSEIRGEAKGKKPTFFQRKMRICDNIEERYREDPGLAQSGLTILLASKVSTLKEGLFHFEQTGNTQPWSKGDFLDNMQVLWKTRDLAGRLCADNPIIELFDDVLTQWFALGPSAHRKVSLAEEYQRGSPRVDTDLAKAFRLLKSAVEEGAWIALLPLSQCYREGLGVQKNEEAAAKLWQLAQSYKETYRHRYSWLYLARANQWPPRSSPWQSGR